jgi:fimbrial chaperone protein
MGLAVLLSTTAMAASFSVNPVRVDLAAERPYTVMQIINSADMPITLQARAYRWTESDMAKGGGLVSTDAIILNPPLLTVLPHSIRYLRLGLRTANTGTTELPYRLVLQEVPKAVDDKEGAVLRTIVRMTIPIFAVAKSATAPKPEWSLQQTGLGKYKLSLANKGTAHIHVTTLDISPAGKTEALKKLNAPIYVLPGQSYSWDVEGMEFNGQTHLKLTGTTDAGNLEETLQATYSTAAATPN